MSNLREQKLHGRVGGPRALGGWGRGVVVGRACDISIIIIFI